MHSMWTSLIDPVPRFSHVESKYKKRKHQAEEMQKNEARKKAK